MSIRSTGTAGHDHFDDNLRQLHAQAVNRVSAGTMAQLHSRRHAALQGAAPRWRMAGWPLAASFASILAVAIGLGFGLQADRDPAAPAPSTAAVQASDDVDVAYAALDENPDFYLWLASQDATLLAME